LGVVPGGDHPALYRREVLVKDWVWVSGGWWEEKVQESIRPDERKGGGDHDGGDQNNFELISEDKVEVPVMIKYRYRTDAGSFFLLFKFVLIYIYFFVATCLFILH
jgi:hypothetical protein